MFEVELKDLIETRGLDSLTSTKKINEIEDVKSYFAR
jgi:hypothetical protein